MDAERGGGRARLASVSDGDAREACGVFGVFAPGKRVAHLTYLGLYALQHRGQESAGMAVADGETLTVVKDMGLVPNVFDDRTLVALTGDLAIGHTRYSTTGSSTWRNAQPSATPPRSRRRWPRRSPLRRRPRRWHRPRPRAGSPLRAPRPR